jgi:competence protein ComGC
LGERIKERGSISVEIPPAPFFKGGEETKKHRGRGASAGYTLVEVIATIVVTAILGVIFIQFMGTAISRSADPVERVRGEAAAEAVMEQIVADYVLKMNQDFSTALGLMRNDIVVNKLYGNNVSAAYIVFDTSGNEGPDTTGDNRTLKVTVNAAGNDLTTLLTQSRNEAVTPRIAF